MPTKARKKTPPAGERPPLYDPAVHVDPDQLVFTELYCACGGLWRQRDPVSFVAPFVQEFVARHTGRGHGPASKAACVQAREVRREARYVAAGKPQQFRARDYPHLDSADTEVSPWPRFPVPESPAERVVPVVPRRLTEGQEG